MKTLKDDSDGAKKTHAGTRPPVGSIFQAQTGKKLIILKTWSKGQIRGHPKVTYSLVFPVASGVEEDGRIAVDV